MTPCVTERRPAPRIAWQDFRLAMHLVNLAVVCGIVALTGGAAFGLAELYLLLR